MWICQNNSFVSIVKDRYSDGLLCRARKRQHLVAFLENYNYLNGLIFELPPHETDYQYRVLLSVDVVSACIANTISKINYDNFKGSVKDDDLYKMYSETWSSGVRNLDEHPDKFDR